MGQLNPKSHFSGNNYQRNFYRFLKILKNNVIYWLLWELHWLLVLLIRSSHLLVKAVQKCLLIWKIHFSMDLNLKSKINILKDSFWRVNVMILLKKFQSIVVFPMNCLKDLKNRKKNHKKNKLIQLLIRWMNYKSTEKRKKKLITLKIQKMKSVQ